MAVITRYVVVRNGVELAEVFTEKKAAEAYDRMLDAGERLAGLIKEADLALDVDEAAIDAIAVLLAQNGPQVVGILRGVKPVAALKPSAADDSPAAPAEAPPAPKTGKSKSKRR